MTTRKSDGASRSGAYGLSAVLVAAAALAACGPVYSTGPDQVHANNPSVTYAYSTDQELIEASERASAFCSQYQSRSLRSGSITANQDGTNSVVFECVPLTATPGPSVAAAPVPPTPPMSYNYTTSQQLLEASQNAESYCLRQGKHSSATVTTNPDGSKAASFHCVP